MKQATISTHLQCGLGRLGPKNPFSSPLCQLQKVPCTNDSCVVTAANKSDVNVTTSNPQYQQIYQEPMYVDLNPISNSSPQVPIMRTKEDTISTMIKNNEEEQMSRLERINSGLPQRFSCSNLMVTEYVFNSEISVSIQQKDSSTPCQQEKKSENKYGQDGNGEDFVLGDEYSEFQDKNLDQQLRRLSLVEPMKMIESGSSDRLQDVRVTKAQSLNSFPLYRNSPPQIIPKPSQIEGISFVSIGSSAHTIPISPYPNSMSVKTILKKEKNVSSNLSENISTSDPNSQVSATQLAKKRNKVQFNKENEVLNYEEDDQDKFLKSPHCIYDDILFCSDDEQGDDHTNDCSTLSAQPRITVLEQVKTIQDDLDQYAVKYVSPNPPANMESLVPNNKKPSLSMKQKENTFQQDKQLAETKERKKIEEENLKMIMDKIKITKSVKSQSEQRQTTQSSIAIVVLESSISRPLNTLAAKNPKKKKNQSCNIFSFLFRG